MKYAYMFGLCTMLALAVPAAPATASLSNAVFVDGTGAHSADFSFVGPCDGSVAITLTIHRATGDDVRQVGADSTMTPAACSALSCLDCPPLPFPFAWTLQNLPESVLLAGGGAGYDDRYTHYGLAWTLQGDFMEGQLEVHGIL